VHACIAAAGIHLHSRSLSPSHTISLPITTAGVLLPRSELEAAARLCAAACCWLVLDNTYEDFVYGGRTHTCLAGPNVINVFSFSKAYGMMG
jgi:histidinol-phosphate/aromatic aminotransferase/cobyric acid decarboxylase-like protein